MFEWTSSRIRAQVIAIHKQMAGSSIGLLRPLGLILAFEERLCTLSTTQTSPDLAFDMYSVRDDSFGTLYNSDPLRLRWQAIPGPLYFACRVQRAAGKAVGSRVHAN
jgi:hypothetical protein